MKTCHNNDVQSVSVIFIASNNIPEGMKSKGSTVVEISAFSLLTLRQGRVKNDFIENGLQYYFFCIRHRAQMTQTENKRNEIERIIPHRDIRVLSLRALSSRMAAKTRANPSAPCSVKPAILARIATSDMNHKRTTKKSQRC